MKFFLAFVGTVCLMGGIHAQISNVATTLTGAVNTATASLASTIQSVNNTIKAADQTTLNAFYAYGNSTVALYNSYYTKYQNYTTVDLSPITNAIANLQSMMTYPPQRLQDDTWNVQQIFTDAQTSAQQVKDTLTAAVATMTTGCGTTCATTKAVACANKFGAQLNSTSVTINRITGCVAAEQTRFTQLATEVAAKYATSVTMATNYLLVGKMCDIPSAAVLNNPSPTSGSPSTQCFTNYLQRFSSMPSYIYTADMTRMTQVQLISFRAKRCVKLVTLDMQDRITDILAKYAACL